MWKNERIWTKIWWILGIFGGIFVLFCVYFSGNSVHACDFSLDEGVGWVDEDTYYMPAEVIIEAYTGTPEAISKGSEGSKWVAFRGSNGMVYEVNEDVLGVNFEVDTDGIYLLTMDSKGSKEWYDDEILVVWRDIA